MFESINSVIRYDMTRTYPSV